MDNSEPRSQAQEPAELTAKKDQHAARSVAAVDNIPDSLRATPQWVCWRYITRDGKRTKAPVNPTTIPTTTAPRDPSQRQRAC